MVKRTETPSRVIAGVITYNPDLSQLKMLLASLLSQTSEIIVFDNDSQNSSDIADLCAELLNIDFRASDQNCGIAKGANEIAKIAREKNGEFLLLFDQDSVPSRKYISSLLLEFEKLNTQGRKIGALAGVQVCNFTGEKSPFIRYGKWFPKKVDISADEGSDVVDFLITSGCLFPLNVLIEVGFFDEALFIDNVDVEWCCRARFFGYELLGCRNAEFSHSIGEKAVQIGGRVVLRIHSPLRTYYSVRNLFALVGRNYISRTWKINSITRAIFKIVAMAILEKNRSEYLKEFVHGLKAAKSIPNGPTF